MRRVWKFGKRLADIAERKLEEEQIKKKQREYEYANDRYDIYLTKDLKLYG